MWDDNPEALRALARMGVADIVLLTGEAGTGKSTLLQDWQTRSKAVVLAPTAVAARRIAGVTLHSFFRLPPELLQMRHVRDHKGSAAYRNLTTVVIDEVSMVRADLFGCVEALLREYGPQKGRPFGGVKMVLTGDLAQLPPVVGGEAVDVFNRLDGKGYASPWFFHCNFLKGLPVELIELRRNYRQAGDAEYARLLGLIRDGSITGEELEWLNSRCVRPRQVSALMLCGSNARADSWNAEELGKIRGRGRIYKAMAEGRDDLLKKNPGVPWALCLKKTARVIFTANDADRRWINGDRGEVIELFPNHVQVRVDGSRGRVVEVGRIKVDEVVRYEWNEAVGQWDKVVIAKLFQLPLRLGWALTIHRAQGMTLHQCHVDLGGGAFAAGQAYVALSRVRNIGGLTLERALNLEDMKTDPRVWDWLASRRR